MRQHALTHKNRDGSQTSPAPSSSNNSDSEGKGPVIRSKNSDHLEIDVERNDDDKISEKNEPIGTENGKFKGVGIEKYQMTRFLMMILTEATYLLLLQPEEENVPIQVSLLMILSLTKN